MDSRENESCVNWASAMEAVRGDHDLLLELIDAFLKDSPLQLEALRVAIRDGDFPTARRAAHTLKGNSRYFGANALVAVALELEEQARREAVTNPEELLEKLAGMLENLTSSLLDYLKLEGSKVNVNDHDRR